MVSYNNERKRVIHERIGDCYDDILGQCAKFIDKEVRPNAFKTDKEKKFPKESLEKLADLGFIGMPFSSKYNGLELPFLVYTSFIEMLCQGCASLGITVAIHGTVTGGIENYANDFLKGKYLPELVSGKKLAAFGLTEPNSGSDAGAMQTKAILDGNSYILNGSKMFITNAGTADTYFVMAKIPEKGISSFIVEKGFEGFQIGQILEKMGVRGSTTGELLFNDCKVPKENLVGVEGKGLKYALNMLNAGRVTVAAYSLGIAQEAYEKSLKYIHERKQFGDFLANYQITKAKIAEMSTKIMAGRQLAYYAANLKDKKADYSKEAAQAKLFASESAVEICLEAIQLHGGMGYMSDTEVERMLRDAKMATIGEGSSEILKLFVIAPRCYEELQK